MFKKRFIVEGSLYDYKRKASELDKFLQENMALFTGNEVYKSLATLIGFLRALKIIHTAHHWQVSGLSYYGDHLLFERLAAPLEDEVDVVAEKIVGANERVLTNYHIQLQHTKNFLDLVSHGRGLIEESYSAELVFVILAELVMSDLERKNGLTRGIEQAIGNILDKHESHIYLLNAREDMEANMKKSV